MAGVANARNAAIGQMTPPMQAAFSVLSRGNGAPTRRKATKSRSKTRPMRAKRVTKRRRRSGGGGKRGHLVKGSAAAKRYMARIRKLRKR
jgi:hypothetical protein